jgi:hypothetical protein
MRARILQTTAFIAGLAFALTPLFIVVGGTTRQIDGRWYAAAVAFSVIVVGFFAALLRNQGPEIAKGLAWSIPALLVISVVLWSLVHLPAH